MDATLLGIIIVLAIAEGKQINNLNDGCVTNSNINYLKQFLPTLVLPDSYYICQTSGKKPKLTKRNSKKPWPKTLRTDKEKYDLDVLAYDQTTQFISLYDPTHKIPIFSAAIVENEDTDAPKLGTRPKWTVPSKDVLDGPTDEDYKVFSDFNRGHLFPWDYAKNRIQAKTTMRLTNAVPQDGIFNKYMWRLSESKLKTNYIDECNKVSTNKAIVVTGSVAQYFGEDPKKDSKIVRIGKTEKNQQFFDPSPTKFNPEESDDEMENKLTVPTHMWTYYLCVSQAGEVLDQVSYIGLNYRTGVIKWYTKLDKFLSTLTKMYRKQSVQFNPIQLLNHDIESIKSWKSNLNDDVEMEEELAMDKKEETKGKRKRTELEEDEEENEEEEEEEEVEEEEEERNPEVEKKMNEKTCFGKQGLDIKTMKCDGKLVTEEDQFWDNVNVFDIRKKNEKHRLNYLLGFYGMDIEIKEKDWIQVDAVSSVTSGGVLDLEEKKRRKRSTVNAEKVIQKAIKITDNDPNSDFIMKECSILETYTNGTVREEHVFNFENNILIQDKNINSGSNLNATIFIDGKATEAKKEVSKKREINIILQKRDGL